MTTTSPFAAPDDTSGDSIQWPDLLGRLLLIEPLSQEMNVNTVHGIKNPVRADVTVIDAPTAPEVFSDTFIFPKVLIDQTKTRIGKQVLARLGQGAGKPGQKPPWVLQEPNDADVQTGIRYLESRKATNPFATPAATEENPPF